MDQIIGTFGIDWKLLLIQAFNFSVLLLILRYFLYTPVMNMIEERQKLIADGVDKANDAREIRRHTEEERLKILTSANKEAEDLIGKSKKAGDDLQNSIVHEAKMKEEQILKEAKERAQEEKRRAVEEGREEMARLAVLTAEKLLRQNTQ